MGGVPGKGSLAEEEPEVEDELESTEVERTREDEGKVKGGVMVRSRFDGASGLMSVGRCFDLGCATTPPVSTESFDDVCSRWSMYMSSP